MKKVISNGQVTYLERHTQDAGDHGIADWVEIPTHSVAIPKVTITANDLLRAYNGSVPIGEYDQASIDLFYKLCEKLGL